MIFYFTGTGNSLYAARSIDSETISIPQIIDHEDLRFSAERIGIVAPIYGHELPQMVKEFIQKASFETDYMYLILTYGHRHANAVELAKKVFDDAGKRIDYIHTVLMVDNFLPAFDILEETSIDKHVDEQLAEIRQDIVEKRIEIEPVTEEDRLAHADYAAMVGNQPATIWADFDFTDLCIGCGLCTKVCPAGCIHMDGRRAVRTGENCQACMACVHVCPETAIRINPVLGFTEPDPEVRYRNENISLTDLVRSNYRKVLQTSF
ncbi:MAG: EFR1 family ferrodoxin [Eubacteriales bacterium]